MEGLKTLGGWIVVAGIFLVAAVLVIWGGLGMLRGIFETAQTEDGWRWLVAVSGFIYYAWQADKREKRLRERIERLEQQLAAPVGY